MDQDLANLIIENNKLIKESLDISKKNTKDLKKVRSFMRRTFIARLTYWIAVILITAGAVYAAKPYVNNAIDTYNSIQEEIGSTKDVIKDSGKIFTDIRILGDLFNNS